MTNQHVLTAAASRRGHNAKLRQVLNELGRPEEALAAGQVVLEITHASVRRPSKAAKPFWSLSSTSMLRVENIATLFMPPEPPMPKTTPHA